MPKGIYNRTYLKKENHNHWKGGKPKCSICKNVSIDYSRKGGLCRNCYRLTASERNPNKGKKLDYLSGPKNPNWKGGISKQPKYYITKNHNYRARRNKAQGSFTAQEWNELKVIWDNMCLCCKRMEPEIELHADHIVPLYLGGLNTIENIQPLCKSCNSRKALKATDYRPVANNLTC